MTQLINQFGSLLFIWRTGRGPTLLSRYIGSATAASITVSASFYRKILAAQLA